MLRLVRRSNSCRLCSAMSCERRSSLSSWSVIFAPPPGYRRSPVHRRRNQRESPSGDGIVGQFAGSRFGSLLRINGGIPVPCVVVLSSCSACITLSRLPSTTLQPRFTQGGSIRYSLHLRSASSSYAGRDWLVTLRSMMNSSIPSPYVVRYAHATEAHSWLRLSSERSCSASRANSPAVSSSLVA